MGNTKVNISSHITHGTESNTANMKESIRWIWIIISPPLILLGTLGNILSIIVCRRKRMRRFAFSICLVVLALADTVILQVGLWRWWIVLLFNVEIRVWSSAICKGQLFLMYYAGDVTCWMVVTMTVQRFISVWFPTKAHRFCSKKASKRSVIAFLLLGFVKSGHFIFAHWESGFQYLTNYTIFQGCEAIEPGYHGFMTGSWTIIDFLYCALLPSGTISICNIMIVGNLWYRKRKLQNQPNTIVQKDDKIKGMNTMLLLNSCVFVTLVTPWYLTNMCINYITVDASVREGLQDTIDVTLIFWYCNSAVNFALYCLGGPMFRRELKYLCTRKNRVSGMSVETSARDATT